MNEFAVIFDMDGVIAHTNPFHAKAFEAFFDKYNIPYTEDEFAQHMYGKHNSYIMTHFFKRSILGQELLDLENEKESLFREIYQPQIKSIPYFLEFLHDLKATGFKTAVATSAPRANMDLILDGLNIRPLMESFMSSENVSRHKPDPEVYLMSAKNLTIPAHKCIVFEDSFSGVTAGLNAGMKVVAVLSTHSKEQLPPCSYYINDYSELSGTKLVELLKG